MNVLIVTAGNRFVKRCQTICAESIRRYCARYTEIRFTIETLPDGAAATTTWSKVELWLQLLPFCDYLITIDADAIIIGVQDFRELIQPHALNISVDCNGINGGSAAYRNCTETIDFLKQVQSMRDKYYGHPWGAQAAMQSIIDKLDVFYQPKHIWNAYAPEVDGIHDETPETLVVHYPGMSPDQPAPFMLDRLNSLS